MARRSGRNPDAVRVVAAQLAGTAERAVIGRGLTDDQALVEFGVCLTPLSAGQRQAALDYATARYIGESTATAAAIAALLERAGADLERAMAIHDERGSNFVIR